MHSFPPNHNLILYLHNTQPLALSMLPTHSLSPPLQPNQLFLHPHTNPLLCSQLNDLPPSHTHPFFPTLPTHNLFPSLLLSHHCHHPYTNATSFAPNLMLYLHNTPSGLPSVFHIFSLLLLSNKHFYHPHTKPVPYLRHTQPFLLYVSNTQPLLSLLPDHHCYHPYTNATSLLPT